MSTLHLFAINPSAAEPIFRQLVEQVRRMVAAGQLRAGDEIPSVRDLAQHLVVHPMTVSKAFGQLEAEGVLTRRRGLPMVVAPQHQSAQTTADRAALLRPTLIKAAREARQLELPPEEALRLFEALLCQPLDEQP
jgi:GntR family transcriptional regulator